MNVVRRAASDVGRGMSDGSSIAWITGGGTGIGRAIAEALLARGDRVVITGRREEVLRKAAGELGSGGAQGRILAIPGDATDPGHIRDVIEAVDRQWGTIDLLVNNAGQNPHHNPDETTLEEYRKTFEINCLSAVITTKSVLPGMLGINRGTVVNISSILGRWGSAGSAAYSVAKYALSGFTDTLRQHLVGTPIHVLGVYPGFIRTDMTMPFVRPGAWKERFGRTPAQMARAIIRAIDRRQPELDYPWYVPWALRFHRWMPTLSDRLAVCAKQ